MSFDRLYQQRPKFPEESSFANLGERIVCDECMWADERYIAVYGRPFIGQLGGIGTPAEAPHPDFQLRPLNGQNPAKNTNPLGREQRII